MLKKTFCALFVATTLTLPCISLAAQLGPGDPVPDPVFKKQKGTFHLGPGDPVPDPVFKKKSSSNFGPGDPVPDPVFKKKSSSN